jgi:LuxR family maltose regulon positive regulatory protein
MLERRLQDGEAKARRSSILELLLLQALAFAAQGERNAAFSALSRALSLAEPEGYVRLFVDEGTPMRNLLRQALVRTVTPHYVATLLAAFGEPGEGDIHSPGSSRSAHRTPHEARTRGLTVAGRRGF